MGRAFLRWFGVVVSATMAVTTTMQGNVPGAVFFGVGTVSLLWWAVRPEPDPDSHVRPLKAMVVGAAVASLLAAFLIAAALRGGGDGPVGLAVVAAISMVAFASLLWGMAVAWRRGWRWSSATTRGQLQAAADGGQPVEAPPVEGGRSGAS